MLLAVCRAHPFPEGPGRGLAVSDGAGAIAFWLRSSSVGGNAARSATRSACSGAAAAASRSPTSPPVGVAGDGHSNDPSLSRDGRYVSFRSAAPNLSGDPASAVGSYLIVQRPPGPAPRASPRAGPMARPSLSAGASTRTRSAPMAAPWCTWPMPAGAVPGALGGIQVFLSRGRELQEHDAKFRSLASLLALRRLAGGTIGHDRRASPPAGHRATLSVDYVYESAGRKQDRIDLHEWRVHRGASLVATLAASPVAAADDAAAGRRAERRVERQDRQGPSGGRQDGADDGQRRADHGPLRVTRPASRTRPSRLGSAMAGTSQLNQTLGAKADIDAMAGQSAPALPGLAGSRNSRAATASTDRASCTATRSA